MSWKKGDEGIDISHHQGTVDFGRVATVKEFAAVKATEGLTFIDPKFETNWKTARAAGLTRVAYHFLRPRLDGAQQADYFMSVVGKLEKGDRLMVDLEVTDGASPAGVLRCLRRFVKQLRNRHHVPLRRVYLYTAHWFWDSIGNPHPDKWTRRKLWLAAYGTERPKPLPGWRAKRVKVWQYSSSGSVPGIAGRVDLDLKVRRG